MSNQLVSTGNGYIYKVGYAMTHDNKIVPAYYQMTTEILFWTDGTHLVTQRIPSSIIQTRTHLHDMGFVEQERMRDMLVSHNLRFIFVYKECDHNGDTIYCCAEFDSSTLSVIDIHRSISIEGSVDVDIHDREMGQNQMLSLRQALSTLVVCTDFNALCYYMEDMLQTFAKY